MMWKNYATVTLCIYSVCHKWPPFQVWWASSQSRLQFVLFWDNVNYQKYVWIVCWKIQKRPLGFPKVKWLQLTGEVGKYMSCWCKKFPQDFTYQKTLKSVNFYSARNARIASAVLATSIPSVCLSVRLSHAGIVSKRRHVVRCSFHRWIAKCV